MPPCISFRSQPVPAWLCAGLILASIALAGCDLFGKEESNNTPFGRVVFTKFDSTIAEPRPFVYSMNTDGSNLTRLSFPEERIECDHPHPDIDACGPGIAEKPRWSPDGKRIAYVEIGGTDEGHIIVMNADGSDKQIITPFGGYADEPRWSPDGERIMYRKHATLGINIGTFVMDADDGSGKTCISCIANGEGERPPPITFQGDTLGAGNAHWGPTSDLLYLFSRGGPPERNYDGIYLFRISTREVLRKVAAFDLTGQERDIRIAPDGSKLLFVKGVGLEEKIYLSASVDAFPQAQVHTSGTSASGRFAQYGDHNPRWGNDSRHFVYTKFVKWESDNGGPKNYIYLADAEGASDGRRIGSVFAYEADLFIPEHRR